MSRRCRSQGPNNLESRKGYLKDFSMVSASTAAPQSIRWRGLGKCGLCDRVPVDHRLDNGRLQSAKPCKLTHAYLLTRAGYSYPGGRTIEKRKLNQKVNEQHPGLVPLGRTYSLENFVRLVHTAHADRVEPVAS